MRLWHCWATGRWGVDELRAVLPEVYVNRAVYRGDILGPRRWFHLFRAAGFLSDGGAEKPAKPMTIYRGCRWDRVRRLSWTTDVAVAASFACANSLSVGLGRDAPEYLCQGLVFEAVVHPRHVLAAFGSKSEAEVVVSPFAPPLRTARHHPWSPEWEALADARCALVAGAFEASA